MSEWQPIETAPKDGTAVLLYSPRMPGLDIGRWYDERGPSSDDPGHPDGWFGFIFTPWGTEPTHWMPLPASPA